MGYIIFPYILFLIPYDILAYPVFGTKRYGRTANPLHSWAMSNPIQLPSYYYLPRTHYPMSYYDTINPYAQEYTDEYYYPQESLNYPLYYPSIARTNPKYEYYQPALPYYYDGRHLPRGYGYYDDTDPVDDLQEEIHQEEEREQREEALPVGQETWYENDDTPTDDSMDDINAAFLQNLMLYNDAMANKNYDYNGQQIDPYMQGYNDEVINWNDEINKKYEDEDVKELKMLAGKPKKQKNKNKNKMSDAEQRIKMFEKGTKKTKSNIDNDSEAWINYNNKRNNMRNTIDPIANLAFKKQELSEHGPLVFKDNAMAFSTRKQNAFDRKLPSSTQAPVASTKGPEAPRDARGGQKEVVLMRPATPVRRPFSEPVMELLAKQGSPDRKRTPSVYDTIKHLLEMEKNLEEGYPRDEIRPPMRKRYVSSEESLVDQLSTLKKTA